jgi:ABC-type Na+ efflux pump permease subunit
MKSIIAVLSAFVLSFILIALFTYPVMLLWNNCLVPAIDSFNSITFWQSLGILILTSILFKSSTSMTKQND